MESSRKVRLFLLLCLLSLSISVSSQNDTIKKNNTTKIKLVQANSFEYNRKIGKNVRRLIGDVIFKHENTLMYCDSAYLYTDENKLDAYSKVHIAASDSTDIYGDFLQYSGNTKIAELHDNITLIDGETILKTQHLFYDRNTNTAIYPDSGRITRNENILTSLYGKYNTNSKIFYFRDSVVLINPDHTVYSDTLQYNSRIETVYFFGPTTITGDENFLYCENGWYDTDKDLSQFEKNAFICNNEQCINGDSIYYNGDIGLAKAFLNITIRDTIQHSYITGHYAEYNKQDGYSFATDSAIMHLVDEKDTLFMHGDTIKMLLDSSGSAESIIVYHKVRFYKSDMQGKADSVVYNTDDSLITFYTEPIIWSDDNQMTARLIKMKTNDNNIEKMFFYQSSFIISEFDTLQFNQIKGTDMIAYFSNNELYKIDVKGNSETMYYVSEEDSSIVGLNKSTSTNLTIYMKDSEVKEIIFLSQPNATLFPIKEVKIDEAKLNDFIWLEEIRPINRSDIFPRK